MTTFWWQARAVSWAALVACAGIACRTTGHRDEGRAAAASAAPPSPSGATRNVPQPAPTLPHEFAIEFSVRLGKTAGTFDLIVAVPSLPDAVVGTVSAREHCGIVPANTPLANDDGSLRLRRGVRWTCREFDVPVWRDGEMLRVGDKTYPLLKDAQITFPSQVKEAARADCARAPSVLTDVRFERRASGDRPDAPWAFGIRVRDEFIEVGRTPRTSMDCGTRRMTSTTGMDITCDHGSNKESTRLVAQGGDLTVKWYRHVYSLASLELERQFGLDLGCGAKPRFFPFTLRDADYEPHHFSCNEYCGLEERDFLRYCYGQSDTTPSPGDSCQTQSQAMTQRCRDGCRTR